MIMIMDYITSVCTKSSLSLSLFYRGYQMIMVMDYMASVCMKSQSCHSACTLGTIKLIALLITPATHRQMSVVANDLELCTELFSMQ